MPPEPEDGSQRDLHAEAATLLGQIARDRDRKAFAELYDRFAGALFGTIMTILRDRAESEDTLQECFCAIWDHADQYDARYGKAVSWMMTIARNKSFDHLAQAKRRSKIADRVEENVQLNSKSTSINAFHTTAMGEEAAAVKAALTELPEEQRTAIQLAFIQGMSQTEVAQSLDQPLGTIKARIRRGLFHLRGVLQPYLVDSTH